MLFYGLTALSVGAAVLIFLVVPERKLPGAGETLVRQIAGFRAIFAASAFWRIAGPLVLCHGAYQAMQGLWLAPWLYDVAGLERAAVARMLLAAAAAYTVGSVFFGAASDRLARAGIERMTVYKAGACVTLAMFVLLAAGVRTGLLAIVALYGFAAISAAIAYALLALLFPPEMTGRAVTASNVLMFSASFLFQWGIGAVLRLYPVADGRYAPEGYAAALWLLAALQLAALAWLLPMRAPQPRTA
jgi:predicted MFS family arabinose efflux permease